MLRGLLQKRRLDKRIAKLRARGEKLVMSSSTYLGFPENISLGNNIMIRENCKLFGQGGIEIGDGCVLAHEIQILSANHNYNAQDLEYLPFDERYELRPVKIGKYVWIGARVTIMPGSVIGDGAVIAGGAVVTGVIPPLAVAGGNPAKILKYRDKTIYEKLAAEEKSFVKEKR